MRVAITPTTTSPTGQHGFDYDIIKAFHKENLNIINDQIDLLTSESEKLTEENEKLAEEITSLTEQVTQLSSLLSSLSFNSEDPFNDNNQQRSDIEGKIRIASEQIEAKKNQITKNNNRITEIKELISEANISVNKANKIITDIIRDIKNADSTSAEKLRRLIENIKAYNQNINNLVNKLSEYGAKYNGDSDVGKVTINGMEHDIRDAGKGFDKKLVRDIAKHLVDNMKLANINPKAAVAGIDDMIGLALIFLLACLGIITIPAVGTTESYTGRIPSLDDIKANANSSASKILNFLLQNAHLFKTKEQMDAEQWAWIWENIRNYSESSSGITEGQSGSEDPGGSTNEDLGGTAKVGDSFGKSGTLVTNPGTKVDWSKVSKHGLERMSERGVTQDMVNSWVQSGKALEQAGGAKHLFFTPQGAAVVTTDGTVVTTIPANMYDEAYKALSKTLFGY